MVPYGVVLLFREHSGVQYLSLSWGSWNTLLLNLNSHFDWLHLQAAVWHVFELRTVIAVESKPVYYRAVVTYGQVWPLLHNPDN